MPRIRFNFFVERCGDEFIIAMDLGNGVIRARHMSGELLKLVGEMCQQLRQGANDRLYAYRDIPEYPGYRVIADAVITGICQATVGAHKLHGKIEVVIAIYDEGDDSAPVLMLVEDQIEDFIRQTGA